MKGSLSSPEYSESGIVDRQRAWTVGDDITPASSPRRLTSSNDIYVPVEDLDD